MGSQAQQVLKVRKMKRGIEVAILRRRWPLALKWISKLASVSEACFSSSSFKDSIWYQGHLV